MFEVTVKKSFFASHGLRNYGAAVEDMHDHNWIIEARFSSQAVDNSGCAIDFRKIDRAFQDILTPFQGICLNELREFKTASPSAENIARFIFEKLSAAIKNSPAQLASVTAWEDEDHGAAYSLP
jgi:6-pyruvoyltetrahydropterin/6-carboxytetrahydropterin synthase